MPQLSHDAATPAFGRLNPRGCLDHDRPIVASKARNDRLLTDVGLPGAMDGRQLTDAAARWRPGLKVLFITGCAESAAVGNCRMEQGMQVMTKPFALSTRAAKFQSINGD